MSEDYLAVLIIVFSSHSRSFNKWKRCTAVPLPSGCSLSQQRDAKRRTSRSIQDVSNAVWSIIL